MNSLIGAFPGSLLRRICLDKKVYSGVRTLYNAQYLGLDVFLNARDSRIKQFGSMRENFMMKIKQQLDASSSLIFTEDLKNIVHIAEDQNDLDICTNMIRKFHQQNKELRFGTFVFGPVIMRMLYHLQKPDLALELLTSEETSGFFDQLRSYLIVMDLLFENGRYAEVIDLSKKLESKPVVSTKFPRDTIVLTLASCYKLNTPESLKCALDIITRARESGSVIVRRALHFTIALCLNQNKPDVAMELLSSLINSNYVTNNNLKIITFAKLGRLQDAFQILRKKVEQDVPNQVFVNGDICQCTLDAVKEVVDNSNDTELSHTFDQLCQSLREAGYITDQTLDGLLCAPIAPRLINEDRFGGDRRSFASGNRYPFTGVDRRSFTGERDDPFFRKRANIPVRQQAFGGLASD